MLLHGDYTRIDTLDLKVSIVKKIGHQRAQRYFDHLRRLFSLKISKCEFDKCCVRMIGRENIPLHNVLVRSIIKNACVGKIPPVKTVVKSGNNLKVAVGNGKQRNCLQSLYGEAFPPSPRKGRSPVKRDHRFRDRPSPLGPLGKTPNVISDDSVNKAQEQQTASELLSLGSRPPVEVASVEDGEEVEQEAGSPCVQSRSPVTAPFGVAMNSGGNVYKSLGKASLYRSHQSGTCQYSGELPDTRSLRSYLQQRLQMKGISVSVDCVNLLNNGLDVYLKRLIEPCIQLAASRSACLQMKEATNQLHPNVQRTLHDKRWQKPARSYYASALDFRSAIEMKPQPLGEDWPMQLEKICLSTSEE